ncbi:hypothetical protein IMSAGC005_00373 [Lachnospiraceae bacterium]|nr:hypothetical protein IMSAGC005_00373 [Lachnospiraceae bacterium]
MRQHQFMMNLSDLAHIRNTMNGKTLRITNYIIGIPRKVLILSINRMHIQMKWNCLRILFILWKHLNLWRVPVPACFQCWKIRLNQRIGLRLCRLIRPRQVLKETMEFQLRQSQHHYLHHQQFYYRQQNRQMFLRQHRQRSRRNR